MKIKNHDLKNTESDQTPKTNKSKVDYLFQDIGKVPSPPEYLHNISTLLPQSSDLELLIREKVIHAVSECLLLSSDKVEELMHQPSSIELRIRNDIYSNIELLLTDLYNNEPYSQKYHIELTTKIRDSLNLLWSDK